MPTQKRKIGLFEAIYHVTLATAYPNIAEKNVLNGDYLAPRAGRQHHADGPTVEKQLGPTAGADSGILMDQQQCIDGRAGTKRWIDNFHNRL